MNYLNQFFPCRWSLTWKHQWYSLHTTTLFWTAVWKLSQRLWRQLVHQVCCCSQIIFSKYMGSQTQYSMNLADSHEVTQSDDSEDDGQGCIISEFIFCNIMHVQFCWLCAPEVSSDLSVSIFGLNFLWFGWFPILIMYLHRTAGSRFAAWRNRQSSWIHSCQWPWIGE